MVGASRHHIRYDMRTKYIVHASVNLKRPRMKENAAQIKAT